MYQDAGDQAFGALGMVWPMIKSAVENSIRKASCTVYWKDGKIEHEYQVDTFWADPERLNQLPNLGGEQGDPGKDAPPPAPPGGFDFPKEPVR